MIMRDVDNKEFVLSSDASISIPHTIRSERPLADQTEVIIQTKSMEEARKILMQEVAARSDRFDLDVEEILSKATFPRDHIRAPLRMSLPLFLSGEGAGRSIIKSCLALAHQASLTIADCEYARRYLEAVGDVCFGHYNETDLIKNRPVGIWFHAICISGDPTKGHILGYAEYFGCYRTVARLSDKYRGEAFDMCYAIDPVSGEELDLDVALDFSQDDIAAILSHNKLDEDKAEDCLRTLMSACLWHLMVARAYENANALCGVEPDQELSGKLFDKWTTLVADNLARSLVGISPGDPLGSGDVQERDEESTS